MCHNRTSVIHWTVEMGCVWVFNDNCTYPIAIDDGDKLKETATLLKYNPSLQILKDK